MLRSGPLAYPQCARNPVSRSGNLLMISALARITFRPSWRMTGKPVPPPAALFWLLVRRHIPSRIDGCRKQRGTGAFPASMSTERHTVWTTIGGTLALLGAAGFFPLIIWAQSSPTLQLWNSRLFEASLAACAIVALVGVYALISPVLGLPMPRLRGDRRPSAAASAKGMTGAASLPVEPPARALVSVTPARRMLAKTPEQLVAMCANLTSLQAKRLVAPYIGEWMEIEGPVENVHGSSDDFGAVRIEGRLLAMFFQGKARLKQLELLARGDRIKVHGKISAISLFGVDLVDCVILEEPPPPAAGRILTN